MSGSSLLPLRLNATPGVLVLPTRNVVSVDFTSAGLTVAHCRHSRHSSHHSANSSSSGVGVGLHHSSQVQHRPLQLLPSAVVPVDLFSAVLFRETFTSEQQLGEGEGSRQKELVKLYAHNCQSMFNFMASRLAALGLSSIKDLKRQVRESRSDYSGSIDGAYVAKSRESINKPFWRSCSDQPLQEVVRQGYKSG